MNKKLILTSALMMASMELQALASDTKSTTKAPADPIGKCYGVVGKGQGDCHGKNPATGEAWGCAGGNPTADLGFKQMTQSECKVAIKHKDAKKKHFEAYK